MTALIIAAAIAALVLAVLLFLLGRKANKKKAQRRREAAERKRKKEKQRRKEQREQEERRKQQEKEQRQAKLNQLKKQIAELFDTNPTLARELCAMAGLQEGTKASDDVLAAIAAKVPEHTLALFQVANTQQDIDFDLKTEHERELCSYPTNDIEPVPMTEMHQLSEVMTEQLLMDDDTFSSALVLDELMVMQPYERKTRRKTLHVLLDISDSMGAYMNNGNTRHDWARGVAVSLLLKAVEGEATYLFRAFNSGIGNLITVSNADEARNAIQYVSRLNHSDGTNIRRALQNAVDDIQNAKATSGNTQIADILIITDGEDNNLRSDTVKQLLGDEIRLNVACIGRQSRLLESLATSYEEFA